MGSCLGNFARLGLRSLRNDQLSVVSALNDDLALIELRNCGLALSVVAVGAILVFFEA